MCLSIESNALDGLFLIILTYLSEKVLLSYLISINVIFFKDSTEVTPENHCFGLHSVNFFIQQSLFFISNLLIIGHPSIIQLCSLNLTKSIYPSHQKKKSFKRKTQRKSEKNLRNRTKRISFEI